MSDSNDDETVYRRDSDLSESSLRQEKLSVKMISKSATTSPTDKNKDFLQRPEQHQENFKFTLKSSGSATGNPRNKCALKPGHSLMDWIRLGSSGCDLAGNKGIISPVSHIELAKHCKLNDAWIAIRGKVYNVTRYMDFHPGGSDELIKGIGKDATKLFDEVHAWVNYEQLLAKCFIGPLRNTATVTLDDNMFKTNKLPAPSNGIFKAPILPFLNTTMTKMTMSSSVSSSSTSQITIEKCEVIPRFDWIQKTNDITIYFYTKSLCNPGVILELVNDSEIIVRIIIDRIMHECNFKFSNKIIWPSSMKLSHETGKIELTFRKLEPKLWINFGLLDRRKTDSFNSLNFECSIGKIEPITHDSYAIILKPLNNIQFSFPIGYHISVSKKINDFEVTRSYTPVPSKYLPINDEGNPCIYLLIKSYENGQLSKLITNTQLPLLDSLFISYPKGNFDLTKIKEHKRIGILAAGSGVTPMLNVLDYLLERTTNKVESINFLYFNKSEDDIWCLDRLESLATIDVRLSIMHILSKPSESWTGESGRISSNHISKLNTETSDLHSTFCCICGPLPFNQLTAQLFKEQNYSENNLHFFQG